MNSFNQNGIKDKEKIFKLPPLPKICVVGPQSSGKSSVLARLIGHDILPTGNSLTTKCVIELNLRNICGTECIQKQVSTKKKMTSEKDQIFLEKATFVKKKQQNIKKGCTFSGSTEFNDLLSKIDQISNLNSFKSKTFPSSKYKKRRTGTNKMQEYAIFDHLPNKYFQIHEIKDEIIRKMNSLGDSSLQSQNSLDYTISAEIIKVTVFLHNVLPLTLLDLPGIVHVPKTSQKIDVSTISKNIAKYFIQNSDIILAVINGCVDIVNSEALSLSHSLNSLNKTIGVLTKLDKGNQNDLLEVLQNKEIVLKHGYFGLVNYEFEKSDTDIQIKGSKNQERLFSFQKICIKSTDSNVIETTSEYDNKMNKKTQDEKNKAEMDFFLENYSSLPNVGLRPLKKHLSYIFEQSCRNYFNNLNLFVSKDFEFLNEIKTNPFYKYKFVEKWLKNVLKLTKNIIKQGLYKKCSTCSEYFNQFSSYNLKSEMDKTHSLYLTNLEIPQSNDTIFLDEKIFLSNIKTKINHIKKQLIEAIESIYSDILQQISNLDTHFEEKFTVDSETGTEFSCRNCKNGISPSSQKKNGSNTQNEKGSFLFSILPFLKRKEEKENEENPKDFLSETVVLEGSEEAESSEKFYDEINHDSIAKTPYDVFSGSQYVDFSEKNGHDSPIYNHFHASLVENLKSAFITQLEENKKILLQYLQDFVEIQTSHVNLQHDYFQININNVSKNQTHASDVFYQGYNYNQTNLIKHEPERSTQNSSHLPIITFTNNLMASYTDKYYEIIKSELVNYTVKLIFFHFSEKINSIGHKCELELDGIDNVLQILEEFRSIIK